MSFTTSRSGLVTTLTFSAGANTGRALSGLLPGTTTRLVGATTPATITGYNFGTAGAGTNPTTLVKPAGGDDWEANQHDGLWVERIGGGGYVAGGDNLRAIKSNTTTTNTIAAMAGLDNTSIFRIVTLSTALGHISGSDLIAFRASSCVSPIELVGMAFSLSDSFDGLLELLDCSDVRLVACQFILNTAHPAVLIERCGRVRLEHCLLQGNSDVLVSRFGHLDVVELVSLGGGVLDVERGSSADITLSAVDAPSRVLSVAGVGSIEVVGSSTDAAGTPFYFEDTKGSAIMTGTNPDALHGFEIAKNAYMSVVGSTITGDGHLTAGGAPADVLIGSYEVSNSDLSGTTYGLVVDHGLGIVGNAGWTKALVPGNNLMLGEIQYAARMLTFGLFNPSQETGITATGTDWVDAFQLPARTFYVIGTCPPGGGVRLHGASVLPGVEVVIINRAANAVFIYPYNETGTINGDPSFELSAGEKVRLTIYDAGNDHWWPG